MKVVLNVAKVLQNETNRKKKIDLPNFDSHANRDIYTIF